MIQRFLPGRSRGGAGHFAHGLAQALAARGHQVTMFSQDPAPPGARYAGVAVAGEAAGWRRKLQPLTFPVQVARQRFDDFDLIHAQGDDQFIRRRVAPPIVRTLHGSSLLEAVHNGWRRGSPKLFLLHLFFYAGELLSTIRADRVVAVSHHTGRFYPRLDDVVPNGVDIERFAPVSAQRSARPSILFVGEVHSRKRGDLLTRVVARQVRPRVPDVRLWLVSPDRIDAPAAEWFGTVDDEQLAWLYREAWVLCLPSTYEGFGRPYVEALAAGAVAVATRNPGALEVLGDGAYGLVVPDAELGDALVRALTDGELRRHLVERGHARARTFDWECVAEQYEAIYERVLARRRSVRAA